MKKMGWLLFVICASVISLPSLSQAGYPLGCRGPLPYTSVSVQGTNPSYYGNPSYIDIQFTKAPYKAASSGAQGLAPGQCAWFDRTVNSAEPFRMRRDTTNAYITTISNLYRGADGRMQLWSYASWGSSILSAFLPSSESAVAGSIFDPTMYFKFNVYNSNTGYFVIENMISKGKSF